MDKMLYVSLLKHEHLTSDLGRSLPTWTTLSPHWLSLQQWWVPSTPLKALAKTTSRCLDTTPAGTEVSRTSPLYCRTACCQAFLLGHQLSSRGPNKPDLKIAPDLAAFQQPQPLCMDSSGHKCKACRLLQLALEALAWGRAARLGTEQRLLLHPLPGCMEEVLISSHWHPVTGHIRMVQSCIRGSLNLILGILAAYIQSQVPLTQFMPRLQLSIWWGLEHWMRPLVLTLSGDSCL